MEYNCKIQAVGADIVHECGIKRKGMGWSDFEKPNNIAKKNFTSQEKKKTTCFVQFVDFNLWTENMKPYKSFRSVQRGIKESCWPSYRGTRRDYHRVGNKLKLKTWTGLFMR